MTDLRALQNRVVQWHVARFPRATTLHVALKVTEEASEVGSAINGLQFPDATTGHGEISEEAADTLIVLLALLGRWFPHVDLLAEASRKLDVLEGQLD